MGIVGEQDNGVLVEVGQIDARGQHDITVTIVDIHGDTVRLGIDAPEEVSVHRGEVYDAIRQENNGRSKVASQPR
ncbi:MAG: carbon storage regulator [Planctomycetes bacterium]|nr:carbon storage regulator [Planctomycetota bacterium]